MVNKPQTLTRRVVKVERRAAGDPVATAKGGLAVVQAVANRLRLWSDIVRLIPKRKDPSQGFPVVAVFCALIHGLLSGGRGFSATEPLRGDKPLLKLLGLSAAPSAETVEEVVKYLAEKSGASALSRLLRRVSVRILGRMSRRGLLALGHGFFPLWLDGSLLEVTGKRFDAIKIVKKRAGQLCVGAFAGPVLTAIDIAGAGVGEQTLVKSFVRKVYRGVVRPLKLESDTLILLDSLHGDEPTLELLESLPGRPAYLVGAQKLKEAQRVMAEAPEIVWRESGPDPKRGLSESGWARMWLQCPGWKKKRPIVCHRYKIEGELFYTYAAIITWLDEKDPQIEKLKKKWNVSAEETLWRLYRQKQGMENQWKELLSDLGLHHPPCAKAAVNGVFYAVAGLAYTLSVGARQLGMSAAEDRGMRLWRFRREVIDLAATVSHHAGRVVARFLDARDHLIDRLLAAMERLARC